MGVLWNAAPLRFGAPFPQPGEADFPSCGFDHSSLAFVRERATPYVQRVLDAALLESQHRHVVVDVRVVRIERGKRPGIRGWHMDTVGDPWHASRPEVHHLFVSGTASLTEFLAAPTELDVPRGLAPHDLMRWLDDELRAREPATVRIPSCTLVSYGRLDLHRATPGLADARRLLVRVTETDVLRPRDRVTRV